jgi:hypothetical protein
MTVQESRDWMGPVVCVMGKVAVYKSPAFPDKLWLNHVDGEGGCFDRAEVEAMVELGPEPLERYFWECF